VIRDFLGGYPHGTKYAGRLKVKAVLRTSTTLQGSGFMTALRGQRIVYNVAGPTARRDAGSAAADNSARPHRLCVASRRHVSPC